MWGFSPLEDSNIQVALFYQLNSPSPELRVIYVKYSTFFFLKKISTKEGGKQ